VCQLGGASRTPQEQQQPRVGRQTSDASTEWRSPPVSARRTAPVSRDANLRRVHAIPCIAREAESEVPPPGAVVVHVVPSDVPEVAAAPPREVDAEVDPLLDNVAE
jgi:hypothetical protein